MIEKLWTKKDVATYLSVDPSTVRRWMRDSRNPLPHRYVGRHPRFVKQEIDAWIATLRPTIEVPEAMGQARLGLSWIEERVEAARAVLRH
ncbi:MAG: helix-turn-helix domain-containing protein [Candidatus Rokubacteria bacterium]|nr:helix-turn-helix domain-containing protein [Candidatus Rokubacteria bacterium]